MFRTFRYIWVRRLPYMTSTKFWDFLTPSPHSICNSLLFVHKNDSFLDTPPAPFCADVMYESSLKRRRDVQVYKGSAACKLCRIRFAISAHKNATKCSKASEPLESEIQAWSRSRLVDRCPTELPNEACLGLLNFSLIFARMAWNGRLHSLAAIKPRNFKSGNTLFGSFVDGSHC